MFGTIATQLLGGRLENRCYALNIANPPEMTTEIGPNSQELFCMTDKEGVVMDDCKERIKEMFTEMGI